MATFLGTGFNDSASSSVPFLSGFKATGVLATDLALLTDSIGDVFFGSGGNDFVQGGNGNDLIIGGLDVDSCNGGGGNDTISIDSGNYIDYVDGGNGIDTLDMSAVQARGAFIDLEAGRWKMFLPAFLTDVSISSIEVFLCGAQGDTINGMLASGNELIKAAGGNDVIRGGGGIDTIDGGEGDDYLAGGHQTDVISGRNGNDTIEVLNNEFGDRVSGGAGIDLLDLGTFAAAGAGIDLTLHTWSITGFGTTNTIAGIENVRGTLQTDSIIGSTGGNSIDGGGGGDVLYGQAGKDTLSGGNGDDLLYGGLGRDTLWGGADLDAFIFVSKDEISGDVIADFTHGIDKINLQNIDAIAGGADDAFSIVGTFTGAAGELRVWTNGTDTLVAGEMDGVTGFDFLIRLWGVIGLTDTDFVL